MRAVIFSEGEQSTHQQTVCTVNDAGFVTICNGSGGASCEREYCAVSKSVGTFGVYIRTVMQALTALICLT